MELKKILYAVDLENAPHPAIEHVKMLTSHPETTVSIVYVVPSELLYEANYLSGEGQANKIAPTPKLQEKMESYLNKHFPAGVHDCAFLKGKISEEIVKYAHQIEADQIVIGAHDHIRFRELFSTPIALDVAKNARCSVSIIHHDA